MLHTEPQNSIHIETVQSLLSNSSSTVTSTTFSSSKGCLGWVRGKVPSRMAGIRAECRSPMPIEILLSGVGIWVSVPRVGSSGLEGTGFCFSVCTEMGFCSGYTGTGCNLLQKGQVQHCMNSWCPPCLSAPYLGNLAWLETNRLSLVPPCSSHLSRGPTSLGFHSLGHHSLRSLVFLWLDLVQLPVPLS